MSNLLLLATALASPSLALEPQAAQETQVGPPPTISDTSAMDPELVALLNECVAAIEANPTDAEARATLGIAYEGNTIWSFAESCYDQVLALDPEADQWRFRRGVVRFYNGDLDAALEDLAAAAEAYKNTPVVQARYGDVLLLVGEAEAAEAAWRQAIAAEANQPQNIQYAASRVGLARALIDLERPDEAIALCTEALQLTPTDPYVHFILGTAYREAGRMDDAAESLAAGRGSFPSFPPDPHGRRLADAARGYSRRMMVIENLVQANQMAEAKQRIDAMIESRPEDHMVLNLAARITLRGGDLAGAREYIEKSIAANAEVPDTLVEACIIDLEEANQLASSIITMQQRAQQGLAVSGEEVESQAARGREVTTRAIERATKAIELAPIVGRSYFWLGMARRMAANFTQDQQEVQGHLQAAQGAMQQAARLGCTEPGLHQQLSDIFAMTGNVRASVKHAERFLELQPLNPVALSMVIRGLASSGRAAEIGPYAARLERAAAGNPQLLQFTAQAYLTVKDFDGAERATAQLEAATNSDASVMPFVNAMRDAIETGRNEAAAQQGNTDGKTDDSNDGAGDGSQ